jgi:hypothetical protein
MEAEMEAAPKSAYVDISSDNFDASQLVDTWHMRRAFMRRVYALLSLQLLLTVPPPPSAPLA